MNRFTISKNLDFNLDKACFKRRATALISWLDCRSTVARLQHDTSTTWFQTSNLIQSNRTAVAENKTQK